MKNRKKVFSLRYIDFHTHILPEMDDGAETIEDALSMLKAAKESGAETVILTPHYQYGMPVSDFCNRRREKLSLLKAAMRKDGGSFPNLLVGAEVLIDGALSDLPDLSRLCIEGTDLILLELPYSHWNDWHFQEVYRIIAERNLSPVMAHIERYLKKAEDIAKIDKLISIGARFQINAQPFLTFSGKRVIRTLAAEGLISAIGSDCHDMKHRSPDITRATNVFAKKFGDPFFDYLYNKTSKLLSEHSI